MRLIVGQSDDVLAADAARAAVSMCDEQLGGLQPKGAIVFASSSYEHEGVLAEVAKRWPGLPVAGCSTDGGMSSAAGFREDSVTVGLLVPWSDSHELDVSVGQASGLSEDLPGSVTRALDGALVDGKQPKLCLVFTNPFAGDLAEVARLLSDRLKCPVLGGGAGDHRTTLGPPGPAEFSGADVLDDGIVLFVVYGDVEVGESFATGWRAIGAEHTVTRAEGPLVFEVDGVPILEQFAEFYSEDGIAVLGSAPLEVVHGGERYMRAVFEVNREAGYAVFGGAVPQGAKVRLTEVLLGGVVEGTRRSIEGALGEYPGVAPQGAFLVHCAASKWVMGTRARLASDAVAGQLEGLPYMGFYAFGEMASASGGPRFHNHTCCSLVFGAA